MDMGLPMRVSSQPSLIPTGWDVSRFRQRYIRSTFAAHRLTMPPLPMRTASYQELKEMPTATADPVIRVGSSPIRIQDVLAVATGAARIALDDSPAFTKKVEASAALLE